ncbi:MAG TPA: amidohydrolase family protein [Stellaceae bacterium]|nr:amidohydrolase family protein [Stellaceae bacterium]
MRVVALEEHFNMPALIKRIDREAILRRGFPPPDVPFGPLGRARDQLGELGEKRLADMDAAGITVEVLSAVGPGADLVAGAEGVALARDMNDGLARIVAEHPDRYAGFAHLPLASPEAAADELERAVKAHGFVGAMVHGHTEGRFLDDPRFAPILARAEALDVPIYLHPGIPPKAVREAYYDGLPGHLSFLLAIAGWGWHAETAVHVLRLALSGTLDRHPRLTLIIGHMGEGLPAMMARFDQSMGAEAERFLKRPISQTILDQVYITTSGFFTVPPFLAALHTFGTDRILFSVDYPFSPNAEGRAFLDTLPLSPDDRAKLAHGNADRVLKLGR